MVVLSALLTSQGTVSGSPIALVIRETAETDNAASTSTNFDIIAQAYFDGSVFQPLSAASEKIVRTDMSRNYNYRKTNQVGGATVRLMVRGWIDRRMP
jgi:radical SAM superfamily enzyme with C-terminal helix-hairpin-helix motif